MASTREEMTGFTLNQQPSTISGEAQHGNYHRERTHEIG